MSFIAGTFIQKPSLLQKYSSIFSSQSFKDGIHISVPTFPESIFLNGMGGDPIYFFRMENQLTHNHFTTSLSFTPFIHKSTSSGFQVVICVMFWDCFNPFGQYIHIVPVTCNYYTLCFFFFRNVFTVLGPWLSHLYFKINLLRFLKRPIRIWTELLFLCLLIQRELISLQQVLFLNLMWLSITSGSF